MKNLVDLARHISTSEGTLTVAYTPIPLEMDGRPPLEMRLTAPATGDNFPLVLLSDGNGPSNYIPSKDAYAPLAQCSSASHRVTSQWKLTPESHRCHLD